MWTFDGPLTVSNLYIKIVVTKPYCRRGHVFMQFSRMDAKPLCRWICFKASRWSGFGCLEYMSMVLFWNMIFGTPTCDSCSRVKVDGFVLRLVLRTPTCEFWSRVYVDAFVLRLDTRNFYVWFLVLDLCRWFCFETWHPRSLRATFLVCALADGFVLRRWCRIIWSPLGSSSGSLDFGFWISNEADYKSIFQFWWLIFSGYPIPGCALWLAGSLPRRLKWPREKKEHPRQRHIIRLGP